MLSALAGKNIVLGISGGIAAYKSVELCRLLVKEGAYVIPVLTPASLNFVGEATWSALASEPAKRSLFEDSDPILHTRLGKSADLILVCPATARLIGSYAAGISDDVLTTTLIATRAPVIVCPAMHTEMWEHVAVQDNISRLKERGVKILGPFEGSLAGSDVGMGRMAEPEEILMAAREAFSGGMLEGMKVLVTGGGTREPLDPVRFLGNRSSGKQGIALARAAQMLGAEVQLVSTVLEPALSGIEQTQVLTAEQMCEAALELAPKADIIIMSAAVADYRPVEVKKAKIRRTKEPLTISLEPTRDILKELVENKKPEQIIVGFAAETQDLKSAVRKKLENKGVDMMVGNDVASPDAGFDSDTNEVIILTKDGDEAIVDLSSKLDVAHKVLEYAHKLHLKIQ